jgi:glycosyltransferase involved in cell wall biosynthesis
LGYGTFGLNLSKGLGEMGVHFWEPTGPGDYWDCPKNYKTMVHATLPNHTKGCWEGQYVVAYTMWEADHLPPVFVENIHNFDMVIVPSDQNLDLFSEVHDNVVKVPLGYDSTFWKRQARPAVANVFNFLWCGAGIGERSRKGSELAIKAFQNAFPKWEQMSPQPHLVMKCLLGAKPGLADFATIHVGQWPAIQLRSLYYDCHCYVGPSRGEGWGYHPLQFVATGAPAILSEIPGHTEYSWLPGFVNVPVKKSKAAYFLHGDAGNWWEPDIDALTEAYHSVYTNYSQYSTEAGQGATHVSEHYSHRQMAQGMCKAIGKENLVETETGDWQEFSLKQYRARSTRNLYPGDFSVNGKRYVWKVGEDQWVDSSIRQILEEAGYLEKGLSEKSAKLETCPHRPELVT